MIMGGGGLFILLSLVGYGLMGRSHSGPVPVIEADQRPVRVRPDNAGGMAVAALEKPADPNQSRLAPMPEEPRPLHPVAGHDGVPSAALLQSRPRSVTVQFATAKTETEAQTIWDRMAKRMPDLLAQHRPLFQKANEPGAPAWRLRTSGFADAARAKAFCDQVKAKGGSCLVVES